MFGRIFRLVNTEGMAGPAFIMLVATIVGGGCNFLYQVSMANLLPSDLAELNTLLAILYITAVPASAVQNVMIRYVSKYHSLGRDDIISWLMRRTLVLTITAGLIISIILVLVLNIAEVRSAQVFLPLLQPLLRSQVPFHVCNP
jgi:O-antigen/teichoic acid export membrane protein